MHLVLGTAEWIGLIGALGGVSLTGVITLSTAALTRHWEEASRREERSVQHREARATLRREAYARLLAAMEAVVIFAATRPPLEHAAQHGGERMRSLREEGSDLFTEMSSAEYQVRLLAGDPVLASLDSYEQRFNEHLDQVVTADDPSTVRVSKALDEALQELVGAMRAEQSAA